MRIKNNIAKMIKHFSGSSVQMEITVPHNVQLRILMALGNPGKFASKLLFTYLWPSCTPQKCQKEGGAQPPPFLPCSPFAPLEYINRVYGIYRRTHTRTDSVHVRVPVVRSVEYL